MLELKLIRSSKGKIYGDVYVFELGEYLLKLKITEIADSVTIVHKDDSSTMYRKYPDADISDNGTIISVKAKVQDLEELDNLIELLQNYKEAVEYGQKLFEQRQEILKLYFNN